MRVGRRSRSGGFTLVELMIVVAMIGIPASAALSSFMRFQLCAQASEAKANLQVIRHAQMAYMTEAGAFSPASASPPTSSGSIPRDFIDTGPPAANFETIRWQPEGRVYFSYAITVDPGRTQATADATGDLDNDTLPQVWGVVHPDTLGGSVVGFYGCAGVLDPGTDPGTGTGLADRHATVGPRGIHDGQSVL